MSTNQSQINRVVSTYEIETNNEVKFKVVLLENSAGDREFEIIMSDNGSDDYSEVFDHPFYNNFVIPWVHKAKNTEPQVQPPTYPENVVSIFSKKKK